MTDQEAQTLAKAMIEQMEKANKMPCPSCGHCSHCGRSNWYPFQTYPYTYPWTLSVDTTTKLKP